MASTSNGRFSDVRWLDEVDSTNRVLLDEARGGADEGAVVVADHQTAGRGRLGRTWVAPPESGLLLSVLLRPTFGVELAHLATAAVGLAAADACRDVAGVVAGLKWPNDLVAVAPDGQERKLAGVLAEADLRGGVLAAIVVGIGIN